MDPDKYADKGKHEDKFLRLEIAARVGHKETRGLGNIRERVIAQRGIRLDIGSSPQAAY